MQITLPVHAAGSTRRLDLRDILAVLSDIGPGYTWRLVEFEAIATSRSNADFLSLERELEERANGKVLSWSELCNLASETFQTINGHIVGQPSFEGVVGDCVDIEMQDSSRWVISTNERNIVTRFEKSFPE